MLFLAVASCYGWFVYRSLHPTLPEADTKPILYSNQCNQDLRFTLIHALNKAKRSVHLVMFGLTEPSILQMLQKKAKYLPIDLYYDPSASTPVPAYENQLIPHPVQSKGLMHQKILVIDDELAFLGSANMTRNSMQMHDNLMIGFHSQQIAKFLKNKAPYSPGRLKTSVGGQQVELWLLPDPRGHALNAIKDIIRRAKYSIRMAMFTLSHPLLVDSLVHAVRRGIQVEIAVDFHSSFGASKKAITKLKKEGARILLSSSSKLLHHKFLCVDQNTLLSGSANWTKAAFYKNHDCFAILHNLTEEQKGFMRKLWRKIEEDTLR